MSGFVDRENEIFDALQRFIDEGLDFVVVGGYGVSAYQHRFSVDADLVIEGEELDEFTRLLEESGFEKETDRDLVYSGRYIAYVKNADLPVTIDLLVDELQCRQTDAAWSYQHFREHSLEKPVEGSEESVTVRAPTRELLIAVKLHSGRATDARDAVALMEGVDFDRLEKHVARGDPEQLRTVLKNVSETTRSDNFEDAFKGVFQSSELPEESIQKLQRFIQKFV